MASWKPSTLGLHEAPTRCIGVVPGTKGLCETLRGYEKPPISVERNQNVHMKPPAALQSHPSTGTLWGPFKHQGFAKSCKALKSTGASWGSFLRGFAKSLRSFTISLVFCKNPSSGALHTSWSSAKPFGLHATPSSTGALYSPLLRDYEGLRSTWEFYSLLKYWTFAKPLEDGALRSTDPYPPKGWGLANMSFLYSPGHFILFLAKYFLVNWHPTSTTMRGKGL